MFNELRYTNTGIGIEVEVEQVTEGFRIPAGWEIKRDDSLRNNGFEYVTRIGCRLKDIPKLLNDLFEGIHQQKKRHPASFSFNERTSIHVHLDARNLSMEELKSLLILYTIYENSLFTLAGESRKNNVFCVPLRYVAMSEVCDRAPMSLITLQWRKYCALNLLRLADLGTVEFRHMEGNDDVNRINRWVHILARLLDYVKEESCSKIMEEIKKLKYVSNYYEFTERIFGEYSKNIDIIPHEFDLAISDSKLLFNLIPE